MVNSEMLRRHLLGSDIKCYLELRDNTEYFKPLLILYYIWGISQNRYDNLRKQIQLHKWIAKEEKYQQAKEA